jgi:hypothetical protein
MRFIFAIFDEQVGEEKPKKPRLALPIERLCYKATFG